MINYYELVINNPAYFKQFSCRDILFLHYDCPLKIEKAAKWSEHHYFYHVLSGRKTLRTLHHSITLTKGSSALIKKGACIIEQSFEEEFCVVVFIMPDSFIHRFLEDYRFVRTSSADDTPPVIQVNDDNMIRGFYQSILPYFASPGPVPEEILELKFKELLLYLLHNPANEELHRFLLNIKEGGETDLQRFMENNFTFNLNIEAYAKMTNRSLSSFKRDFKEIYKTTPGSWLLGKKLEHASKLLTGTADTVASIAFDCGFENTAHFCRIFKQKKGCTPLQFRKQAGNALTYSN